MLHKTPVALAAVVALGRCVLVATNALAAGHAHGGHVARYGGGYRTGPIYDSCTGFRSGYGPGYAYGGCPSDSITFTHPRSHRPWTAGTDPLSH